MIFFKDVFLLSCMCRVHFTLILSPAILCRLCWFLPIQINKKKNRYNFFLGLHVPCENDRFAFRIDGFGFDSNPHSTYISVLKNIGKIKLWVKKSVWGDNDSWKLISFDKIEDYIYIFFFVTYRFYVSLVVLLNGLLGSD